MITNTKLLCKYIVIIYFHSNKNRQNSSHEIFREILLRFYSNNQENNLQGLKKKKKFLKQQFRINLFIFWDGGMCFCVYMFFFSFTFYLDIHIKESCKDRLELLKSIKRLTLFIFISSRSFSANFFFVEETQQKDKLARISK